MKSLWKAAALSMWVCVLGACVPALAQAQEDAQTAAARDLFDAGVAHAEASEWHQAAEAFARAHALRPSSAIAYNWASALIEAGDLLEGAKRLRELLDDPEADDRLKVASRQALDEIEPRLASVTFSVEGDSAGIEVFFDANPLPMNAWETPLPANPGRHEVVAMREGELVQQRKLMLREGERARVALTVPPAAAPATLPSPRPAPSPPDTRQQPPRAARNAWLWTTLAVVVVAGATAGAALATKDQRTGAGPTIEGSAGTIRW